MTAMMIMVVGGVMMMVVVTLMRMRVMANNSKLPQTPHL